MGGLWCQGVTANRKNKMIRGGKNDLRTLLSRKIVLIKYRNKTICLNVYEEIAVL